MDPAEALLAAAAGLALCNGTRMVEPWQLLAACPDVGDVVAAAVELRQLGLIQLALGDGPAIVLLALTDAGLLHHLAVSRLDLPDVRARLAATASQAAGEGAVDLARTVGEPRLLVECLLDSWVADRLLTYSPAPGGRFRVHRVLAPLPVAPGSTETELFCATNPGGGVDGLPGTAAAAAHPAAGEASAAEPAPS